MQIYQKNNNADLKGLLKLCLIFSSIAVLCNFFISNQPLLFTIGIITGLAVGFINLFLLKYVINGITGEGSALISVISELFRMSIYGISACIMYYLSFYALAGYAAGVIIYTACLMIFYGKVSTNECK